MPNGRRGPACHDVHPGQECTRTAPGGYCIPPRCYCGSCPWFEPMEARPTYTPDTYTRLDRAAVESGKRASGVRRAAAR